MKSNNFALVIEGDVFFTWNLNSPDPIAQRLAAGFTSNPIFVKADNYPIIHWGCLWDGKNFYPPGDFDKKNPYEFIEKDPLNKNIKFAGVVEGEVFGLITHEHEFYGDNLIEMLDIGFQSNPEVIEIPINQNVGAGYTWDGIAFKEPSII
jgi:hypothetical protein